MRSTSSCPQLRPDSNMPEKTLSDGSSSVSVSALSKTYFKPRSNYRKRRRLFRTTPASKYMARPEPMCPSSLSPLFYRSYRRRSLSPNTDGGRHGKAQYFFTPHTLSPRARTCMARSQAMAIPVVSGSAEPGGLNVTVIMGCIAHSLYVLFVTADVVRDKLCKYCCRFRSLARRKVSSVGSRVQKQAMPTSQLA